MSRESLKSKRHGQPLIWRAALAGSMLGMMAAVPGCPSGSSSSFSPTNISIPGVGNRNRAPVAAGPTVSADPLIKQGLKGVIVKKPTEDMTVDEAWEQLARNEGTAEWADAMSRDNTFSREALSQKQAANASQQLAGKLPLQALELLVQNGADKLATSLPLTDEIKKAQRKQVLVVGKFENDVAANKELDYALGSLQTRLNKQQDIRDNFVVVGMSEKAGETALKQAGAGQPFEFEDPLDPTKLQGPTKYNPKTIYAVSGRMVESRDDVAHRMYLKMAIDVTHSATRRLVDSHEVEAEYRFHPAMQKWISKAEDEQIAARRGKKS